MPCFKYNGEIARFSGKNAYESMIKAIEKMKNPAIIVTGDDLSDHGFKPCYLLLKPNSPIPKGCKIINLNKETLVSH